MEVEKNLARPLLSPMRTSKGFVCFPSFEKSIVCVIRADLRIRPFPCLDWGDFDGRGVGKWGKGGFHRENEISSI